MNILIDLQHPAHLHFFRHAAARLESEGHRVRFTGWQKDILADLAAAYGIRVEFFGRAGKGVWHLGRQLLYRQARLLRIAREFKPDVMAAIAGTFVSLVGWLTRTPVYVFYDTEHATVSNLLSYPFATCVYVPRCYRKRIRWRHERYDGYHELAYLHPKYFTPDASVLAEAGLSPGEKFALVRFVGWAAAHDIGRRGFSREGRVRAVQTLAQEARVFVSCEGELPPELEPYRLRIHVARVHDLMAFAGLILGEGATMCSEGAVLGVPGVYVNPLRLGYLDEQEQRYGLVFNFAPHQQEQAVAKGVEILRRFDASVWQARRQRLLADHTDVTEMVYRIVMGHDGKRAATAGGGERRLA